MSCSIDKARVIWNALEGETLVINTETGFYYSLDEVGGEIWKLLVEGQDEDAVVSAILAGYEADEALVRADVRRLTAQLEREKLIIVA